VAIAADPATHLELIIKDGTVFKNDL